MLILLIANFLIRSGRLDKAILVVKNAYKRRGVRVARAALLLMLIFNFIPGTFGGNSIFYTNYHHNNNVLPVPQGVNNMLFYLQRDPDANTIVYQLNLKDGEVDKNEPVNAFWIKYADKGQVARLSGIQRRLAYGLRSKFLGKGKHELRFVSYPDLPLYLVREGDAYNVFAEVGKRNLILNRIFVRVKEGHFALPKVEYVDLIGRDARSGEPVNHRIII